jgi:signal-transduction protein with cAMP-binding, CBS, and nucleotidyltransferase domain
MLINKFSKCRILKALKELLWVLRLRDVMVSPVMTTKRSAKISEAASTMCANNIGSLVVVDDYEKPAGIVTERDMLRKIIATSKSPKQTDISQIMSSPLVTGDPDMDVEYAAKLMLQKDVKRLPIVENGKLIGIVTFTDVMRAQPQIVIALERSLTFEKLPKRFRKWMRK